MTTHRLRTFFPLGLVMAGLLIVAGCDSQNSQATVTARAVGTNSVNASLTANAATETLEVIVSTTGAGTSGAAGTPTNSNTTNPEAAGETFVATAGPVNTIVVTADNGTTAFIQGQPTGQPTRDPSIIPSVTQPSGTVDRGNGTSAPAPFTPVPSGTGPAMSTATTLTPTEITYQGSVIGVRYEAGSEEASPKGEAQTADTAPTEWLDDAPLYSLFVRSFRDSNGDGIGDLRGVIDGLDYLQSLGVGTIWLLPVFKAASYHGYDTTDFYNVNPDYGTNEDLAALITEVHKRGMNILLDYVVNHVSNKHPFFLDAYNNLSSKYADFFLWSNDAHTEYTGFAGLDFMPRLNYESQAVVDYASEVALYWLDPNKDGDFSDGIDGWRCDVAIEVRHSFWKQLRTRMESVNPRAVLLGEFLTGEAQKIRPYMLGDEHHATFDFPGLRVLNREYEINGDGVTAGKEDPVFLGTTVRGQTGLYAPGQIVIRLINNHDTNRIMSEVNGDQSRARAAAFWMFTAPGAPILYYGEEIGMFGSRDDGPIYYDEPRREPFDWHATESGIGMTDWYKPGTRNNKPNDGISVEEQDGNPDSLLTFYRELGTLRFNDPTMTSGQDDAPRFDVAPVLVSRHWDENTLYLAFTNFAPDALTFTLTPSDLFPKDTTYNAKGEVVVSSGYTANDDSVSLAPAGYVLLRFTKAVP